MFARPSEPVQLELSFEVLSSVISLIIADALSDAVPE